MPTGSWSWSTTTSIPPTWIRWCGRCARASSRAKASKSCAVAGARCSTPWPTAATIRAMRASSSMPAGRGRGATPFPSWRARARNTMPASVPNGRTFCRADRRACTLPRYLAPALPGLGQESRIGHGRVEGLAQRLLAIRRQIRGRREGPRYRLPAQDQFEDLPLAVGGREVENQRHVRQVRALLQSQLRDDVDALVRDPVGFEPLEARP